MSIPPIQALSPEINIYGYIIILKKRHCSEASWSGPSNHMHAHLEFVLSNIVTSLNKVFIIIIIIIIINIITFI